MKPARQPEPERVSEDERNLRDVNEALLVSSVHQHYLTEQARNAEAMLRESQAQLHHQLADTELLRQLSTELIESGDVEVLYGKIVDAVATIMESDRATLEELHPEAGATGELRILASSGCDPKNSGYSGQAGFDFGGTRAATILTRERSIASDIGENDFEPGSASMASWLEAGVRAAQTTPLLTRGGTLVGTISTQWKSPHVPSERDLRLMDIVARQAADFIEREQDQQRLLASEERYRTIVEQVKDYAIFSTDLCGRATSWNQGVERVLGFDEHGFLGLDVAHSIFTPEDISAGVPERELEDAASEGAASSDRWMQRKDGILFFANGVTTGLKNAAGHLVGFTKVMRDQTEKKLFHSALEKSAAELARINRRKDEFLAMLSHELRNPLAPIMAAAHVLRERQKDNSSATERHALQIIERQAANLTKIVNDLLEVSRIVSGRIHLRPHLLALNEVLRHAVETTQVDFDRRHHAVSLHLCDECLWVNADAVRLEEVFVNLLSNASKYTPDGGHIQVSCEQQSTAECAEVRIRDDGVGIGSDLLEGGRLFDLFTQADRSLARSSGGLGVGLSLAYRLVKLHGGTIEACSPPQGAAKGSEIVVRLPLATPTVDETPPVPDPDELETMGVRVLLVDDNVDLVAMTSAALRRKGYSVQVAYNGPDGLHAAQQWRPDVVLLDVGLPGMDGYQVARALRADSALGGVTMRLVAMTGYGRDSDVALAAAAGFDAHLTKPVAFEDLEQSLGERLDSPRPPVGV